MNKQNQSKKSKTGRTATFRKHRLALALLAVQGMAWAELPVPIAPVISAGTGDGYSEAEPNLWFLLDDSGSMGFAYSSTMGTYGGGRYTYPDDYIPYDPNTTYQLPYRLNGTDLMPLPSGANQFYYRPFQKEAAGTPQRLGRYASIYSHMTCTGATDQRNCSIWLNYYSLKLLTLKSTLSLVLFSDKYRHLTERVRIGYDTINGHQSGHRFPVLPFYGTNATTNQKEMHKWLYSLTFTKATPLRYPTGSLMGDIQTYSSYSNANNPFLVTPGSAPSTDNTALMCRRNYLLVMTDGQWNQRLNYSRGKWTTDVRNSYSLKDGKTYTPMGPYNRTYVSGLSGQNKMTIADLALWGWKTDIDGDASNNDLEPKYTKDANGDTVALPAAYSGLSAEDKVYWHPWNDPASWQHISTFTMNFRGSRDVGNTKPPTMDSRYLDPNWTWSLSADTPGSWQIGFDSAARDLANAAMVGRGRYYDVQTPADMMSAFEDLLNQSKVGATIPTTTGGAGSAGASQTLGNSYYFTRFDSDQFTGELIKYDLWSGETDATTLQECFHVNNETELKNKYTAKNEPTPVRGTRCEDQSWNAATKLAATAVNTRNIITGKRTYDGDDLTSMTQTGLALDKMDFSLVDFDTDNISDAQKARLLSDLPAPLTTSGPFTTNEQRLTALFDFVKGSNTNEGVFRKRGAHKFDNDGKVTGRNILGAIIRSAPKFVGIPTAYVAHLSDTATARKNYTSYIKNYIKHNKDGGKEVVYVGSDDGMLHAFNANSGEEIFAYVPSAVYDALPQTVVPEKQLSLVDGNIDVQTVYFDDKWYRALVAGMGGGARGFFALDVTAPKSGAGTVTAELVKKSDKINWEYGDLESRLLNGGQSNVGNILAAPAMVQLSDDNWVAIVGNGYNSESGKAAVIVVDLETGKPIQELVLPSKTDTKPNGLGPLYFVSYSGKETSVSNRYDRAYAGDLQGQLWVFDLTDSSIDGTGGKTKGIKVVKQNNVATPLFTAVDDDGNAQPITVYPLATKHPLGYGYLLHFGTGALFDKEDLSTKVNNSIYAIWDDWIDDKNVGLPTGGRTAVVENSQLNEIKLASSTAVVDGETVTVRYLERDANGKIATDETKWALTSLSSGHRGWKIKLGEKERAWQPAYVSYGSNNDEAISYNTIKYTENSGSSSSGATQCKVPGSGVISWQLAFNINDAAKSLSSDNGSAGTIDVNKDGLVNSSDLVSITSLGTTATPAVVSGLQTSGNILYNSNTQRIKEVEDTGSGANANQRNGCHFNTQLTVSSSGGLSSTEIQRCSMFTSWSELK